MKNCYTENSEIILNRLLSRFLIYILTNSETEQFGNNNDVARVLLELLEHVSNLLKLLTHTRVYSLRIPLPVRIPEP